MNPVLTPKLSALIFNPEILHQGESADGGLTLLGNHKLNTTRGGGPDRLNNNEQIVLESPEAGVYQVLQTLTLHHKPKPPESQPQTSNPTVISWAIANRHSK